MTARKPPGSRLRKGPKQRPYHGLHVVKREEIPSPPAGLLRVTCETWCAYWRSDLAKLWSDTDEAAVVRLFRCYDERERAYRALCKKRIALGSKMQPVMSPLVAYVNQLDGTILNLEDRLGLNPKARLALGVQLGDARRSLDELNAAVVEEQGQDQEDPRIQKAKD